ncbi:MAG: hypothetical protein R3298_06115 [Gammaproteobacteria bacterium]|nr:hypothetical protein [Gammaproteobacteria bacterium]
MKQAPLLSIMAVPLLAACTDSGLISEPDMSPKLAAELCHGASDKATPEQGKTVAAYRAGKIQFEECMRRLRG